MSAYNASRLRALGAELKSARLAAGMTQKEVAERIGRQHSRISKWEHGTGLPDEVDLGKMLMLYGIIGDQHEDFLQLAREAAEPNWVSPGVGRRLASFVESEKLALRIVNYEPVIIPGLCQTGKYAREIMVTAGVPRDQISQRVDIRLSRQALLTYDDGPEYVAVIAEQALRYPQCDRPVMVEQLRHLLTLAGLPNVSIHVLPFGTRARAIEAPFVLIEPRHGDPMVHQEHYRATTTLTNPRDVREGYQAAVDEILRKAMSKVDSTAFITKLLKEMESAR